MIPSAVFLASLRMLDVLEAEESLDTVTRLGVGTATADLEFRRRQVGLWRSVAGLIAVPPKTRRQMRADVIERSKGMGLVKVPARG